MAGLDDSVWVSAAEAARLTGMHVRTIKRMAEEGQLKSLKTPGRHTRVLRADLNKLLRPACATSVSASSLLSAKREEVESLGLELQAERGRRDLAKLHEQDAAAEREKKEARQSERLANKRALAEIELQRERDRERLEREEREAEAARRQADFERRWLRWAESRLFDWLTFEQQQSVLQMVRETVAARSLEDEGAMQDILVKAISRFCAPWDAERKTRAKREELIESILRGLVGATPSENLRAVNDAREVLSHVPLSASDIEIRAAVTAAIEPTVKTINQRRTAEEASAREKWARKQAENEKARTRQTRQIHKSLLIADGVARVDNYLDELYADEEIDADAYFDSSWRS